jgi:NAD(P)-dependent dehydrogenase (short-subunit alcohol dehydrogenase family)
LRTPPRLDVLVTCAGLLGGYRSFEDHDPEDWRRIVEVNLIGVFEVCRQALPPMRRAGWGRIVTMGSLAGKEGLPHMLVYSAASAGVIAFTKALGNPMLSAPGWA